MLMASKKASLIGQMKYMLIGIFSIILVSCGTVGGDYVADESGEKRSNTILYKDGGIFVHLNHFDGNMSIQTIYQQDAREPLDFRIVRIVQRLYNENTQIASSSRNNAKGMMPANSESSVLLLNSEVYEIDKPLERATEQVVIEFFIDEKPINIRKVFSLMRVTYNRFQALMGI